MLRIKKKKTCLIYIKTDQNQPQTSCPKVPQPFNNTLSTFLLDTRTRFSALQKENQNLLSTKTFSKKSYKRSKMITSPDSNIEKINKLTHLYKLKSEQRKQNGDVYYEQNCLINKIKIVQVFRQGTFANVYRATLSTKNNCMEILVKKIQVNDNYTSRQQYFAKILKSPYVVQFIGTYTTIQTKTNLQSLNLLIKHNYKLLNKEKLAQHSNQVPVRYLNIAMKKYGNNLDQILQLQTIQPVSIKIFLYQMIRSLVYIHSLGICHRDIKPHNFVIKDHRVFLCDFGAAKDMRQNQKSVSYIFSRSYRAPELLFDYQQYDKSVDIWALGCVAAQMVLRKPLFNGSNNLDQLIKIFKIIGSPKWQIISFCKNRLPKIPDIKGSGLKELLSEKCDISFIKLLQKMIVIEPKQRISAIQALCDPYFDDVRQQSFYRMHLRGTNLPNFFYFSKKQSFCKEQYLNRLIPFWIKQHCKRFNVKLKDYNF